MASLNHSRKKTHAQFDQDRRGAKRQPPYCPQYHKTRTNGHPPSSSQPSHSRNAPYHPSQSTHSFQGYRSRRKTPSRPPTSLPPTQAVTRTYRLLLDCRKKNKFYSKDFFKYASQAAFLSYCIKQGLVPHGLRSKTSIMPPRSRGTGISQTLLQARLAFDRANLHHLHSHVCRLTISAHSGLTTARKGMDQLLDCATVVELTHHTRNQTATDRNQLKHSDDSLVSQNRKLQALHREQNTLPSYRPLLRGVLALEHWEQDDTTPHPACITSPPRIIPPLFSSPPPPPPPPAPAALTCLAPVHLRGSTPAPPAGLSLPAELESVSLPPTVAPLKGLKVPPPPCLLWRQLWRKPLKLPRDCQSLR